MGLIATEGCAGKEARRMLACVRVCVRGTVIGSEDLSPQHWAAAVPGEGGRTPQAPGPGLTVGRNQRRD